jgi:uncharacterized protein YceK
VCPLWIFSKGLRRGPEREGGKVKKILALMITLLLTGCATMLSKNTYQVPILSEPSAHVTIVDTHTRNVVMTGETPFIATLSSKRSYCNRAQYVVVAEKKGYTSQEKALEASLSAWIVGDILLDWGIISFFCIDANTGNIWNLNEKVNFYLEKNRG